MTSLADIPGEARCKQLIHELVTKQKSHPACGGVYPGSENMAGAALVE